MLADAAAFLPAAGEDVVAHRCHTRGLLASGGRERNGLAISSEIIFADEHAADVAHVAVLVGDDERVDVVEINHAGNFLHALRRVEHGDFVGGVNRIALRVEALEVVAEETVSHPDGALLIHPERARLHAVGVRPSA